MQLSRIGEQLPCTREPGTRKDPFAVAVVRSSVTVSQQLNLQYERSIVRVQVCMSARPALVRRRWAWLTRIHSPRKLFPRNFVQGQSTKILSLENLALYGISHCNVIYLRMRTMNCARHRLEKKNHGETSATQITPGSKDEQMQ